MNSRRAGRGVRAGFLLFVILSWTSLRVGAVQLQRLAGNAFWTGRFDAASTKYTWLERVNPLSLAAVDGEMETQLGAMEKSAGEGDTPGSDFSAAARKGSDTVGRLVGRAPLRPETWGAVVDFFRAVKVANQQRRVYAFEKLSIRPEENLEPEDLMQLRALEMANGLDPNGVYYWDTLGDLCWNLGLHSLALKFYAEAVTLLPDPAQHPFLSAVRLAPELRETAIRAMERAVEPPRNASPEMVYRELGNFLLASGRFGEAGKAFKKAEALAGGENYVSFQAYAAYMEGHNEEAVLLYRRALLHEPLDGESRVRTYLNLGQLLEELGRRQEAVRELRNALSLDPRNLRALLLLGKIDEELGELEEAEEMYSMAADSSTDRITPLVTLIDFYRRRGRPAEALLPAWKLVQLEPDETTYRDLLRQLQTEIEGGRR